MFLQQFQSAHYGVERRFLPLVHPVSVMQFARPINGQADEKLVGGQKFAPFIVQQSTIGLQGIGNFFAAGIFLL